MSDPRDLIDYLRECADGGCWFEIGGADAAILSAHIDRLEQEVARLKGVPVEVVRVRP